MGKGSGRRPESVAGAYAAGYAGIFRGDCHNMQREGGKTAAFEGSSITFYTDRPDVCRKSPNLCINEAGEADWSGATIV